MLLLFALASCENETYTEQAEETTEVEITSVFNLQMLEKKANIDEILTFLNVYSINEIEFKEYKYDGYSNAKGEEDSKIYVCLTGDECNVKSDFTEKYAILEVNPEIRDALLVSTITKNTTEGIVSMNQFDSKEQYVGNILIEYDMEKEIANFTWKGFNSKGCWNDCMVDELRAIENGNWIKKASFLIGLPMSAFVLYASCGWDCIVD